MTLLQLDPAWAVACAFILSLCVGSFLNVVIHRLPIMMEKEWLAEQQTKESINQETFNLSSPDSTCPQCGHKIRWYENIPVLSYLYLRAKCSSCSLHIPFRYPAIELLTAITGASIVYIYGLNEVSLSLTLLSWALICLIFIDIDHQLLPDRITLPLIWAGLLANSFGLFTSLESAVYGAIAGYLSLWSVYWAFKLITGKEGMGYGDFKLLAALGAWAGLTQIPLIVLLSSVVGAVLGIIMILTKRQEQQTPIPFGPYLAIAGWIAIIWGDNIMGTYLQFIGI